MFIQNWSWIDYQSLSSTNDLAFEYSKHYDKTPHVFTAIVQTAGRGRRGRNWVSEQGNLFMSQLFQSDMPITYLVFIASLSIAETISELTSGLTINIKWPNDILIADKKVCGILIEKAENDSVIIGIGINLVSSPEDSVVMYPAIDLKKLGFTIYREQFLQSYLKIFNDNIQKYHTQSFNAIRTKWLSFAYRLNQIISINQGKGCLKGVFKDIDEQGYLLLEQENNVQRITTGDIMSSTEEKK